MVWQRSSVELPEHLATLEGFIVDVVNHYVEPYTAPYTSKLTPLYDGIEFLAAKAKLSTVSVLFASSLIFSYFIGLVQSQIRNPTLKHIHGFVWGIALSFFTYQYAAFYPLVVALLCYVFLLVLPRSFSHRAVFAFSFACLLFAHYYRYYVDYLDFEVDFSSMQMILTFKVIGFAMNYHDGSLDEKDLLPVHRQLRLKRLPNLIQYLGYIYFFPTALSGPVFDYVHYDDYVHNYHTKDGRLPSGRFKAVLNRVVMIGISLIGFLLVPMFPRTAIMNEELFSSFPLWKRLLYTWMVPTMHRMKYYFSWYMAEGALVTAGLGYNGFDATANEHKWDKVINSRMLDYELGSTGRALTDAWNISASKWLKTYIYLRVGNPAKQKPGLPNLLASFFISALWHGFYPGYYMFFLTAAFWVNITRMLRRNLREYFVDENATHWRQMSMKHLFYNFCGWFGVQFMCNYLGVGFCVLAYEHTMRGWRLTYYIAFVFTAVVIAFLQVLQTIKRLKPQAGKKSRDSAPAKTKEKQY